MTDLSTSTRYVVRAARGCREVAAAPGSSHAVRPPRAGDDLGARAGRCCVSADILTGSRLRADLAVGVAGGHPLTGACAPSHVPDLNFPLTKAKTTPWPTGQRPNPASASSKADPTTSMGAAT